MKMVTVACALVVALQSPAIAQTKEKTPGRELAELVFGSIEEHPNGTVDMGEFVRFGNDIYVSMDYDESGSVDLGEFMDWDFGFDFVAEDEGQKSTYETAQKIVFAFWDHDGNGDIAPSEYRKSMSWDFRRADTDDNAILTEDEFLRGYIINVAYRAALTGQ